MTGTSPRRPAYQLPVRPDWAGGRCAEGFVTPASDTTRQMVVVLPKRVLPIIFLPGIMGSNLRMSAARQTALKKGNNVAWQPDNLAESSKLLRAKPAAR